MKTRRTPMPTYFTKRNRYLYLFPNIYSLHASSALLFLHALLAGEEWFSTSLSVHLYSTNLQSPCLLLVLTVSRKRDVTTRAQPCWFQSETGNLAPSFFISVFLHLVVTFSFFSKNKTVYFLHYSHSYQSFLSRKQHTCSIRNKISQMDGQFQVMYIFTWKKYIIT